VQVVIPNPKTARNGRYHQKSQILDLEGDINVFHDAGYQFQTEKAEVDLANDTVTGEEPVTGHGPGGTIDATGFMILDRGGTLVFTGPSKLHLNPGAGKAEPAKPAGKAGGKAR